MACCGMLSSRHSYGTLEFSIPDINCTRLELSLSCPRGSRAHMTLALPEAVNGCQGKGFIKLSSLPENL